MMIEILNICKSPMVKDNVLAEEEDDILALDADEAGYQSAFARLHSIAKIQTDPAADVQDLTGFTKAQLVPLLTQAPEVCSYLFEVELLYCYVGSSTSHTRPSKRPESFDCNQLKN